MKKILQISILSLIIVFIFNIIIFTVITTVQTTYNNNLPQEIIVSELFGRNVNAENTYYMNGERDLENTEEINKVLLNRKIFKLSEFDSYKFIFSVSEKDYILVGKAITSSENNDKFNSVVIYKKDNCVYFRTNAKTGTNKSDFAVYRCEDSDLIENITKYKSNSNKYYVFDLPKWRHDLLSFNLEGKLIVVSVIVEYIICLFLLKKKNRL
jgi:hypothetical protein